MKAFDPGGGGHCLAHRHSQTPASGQCSSAQFCARRDFVCSRGLKEGIFLEDAEDRVLHSTCRATHYFIATIAQALPLEDPSKRAHFCSVLKNVDIKTSDGSVRSTDNVAGGMEEERTFTGVDVIWGGHNKVNTIMGCGDVQPEQENFVHVARSCDVSLQSSSHLEASFLFSSKSLPNSHDSTIVNFTSSQAVDIPSVLTLHISCQDVRHACSTSESCAEDPEGPLTPDLHPEVRSWDCDILCTKGADDMLPADNLLMEQEDVMSTCILQCQIGPGKCLDALMCKDACEDRSSLPGKSSNFCDYWEGVNRRHALRKPASRRYKTSSLGICAAPNKKKSHSRSVYTLQFRLAQQKHIKLLKGNKGEVVCEQLLADIQLCLQAYKPRLIFDGGNKDVEASKAACYSRTLACNQVHSKDKAYARRNGHQKMVNMEMVSQEQVLGMLHACYLKYIAGKGGNHLQREHLFMEQDNYETKHYTSILSSEMGIDSTSKLPHSLEVKDGGLGSRTTEPSSKLMDDSTEDESHGSPFSRIVRNVDDWNSIPIDQVDQCLDTCLSRLQPRQLSFPYDLAPHSKLLDVAVRRSPSEFSNIKCSNGNKIDEGFHEGNQYEASCLPTSAVDEPHSHTPSQCISSLSLNREELKSSMPPHERQRKEKLEHFAEGFLLRRQIIQQQRKAQQAPPFPPGNSAVDVIGTSRRMIADVRTTPYTYISMQASIKCPEVKNHEPTRILASSLTKPDVVIDIVGLVKYIESHSGQSEAFTDVVANSINYTQMPLTGGQLGIPNVSAMIVTIVAIVVYTKVLFEGALAWVGAHTQSKEKD